MGNPKTRQARRSAGPPDTAEFFGPLTLVDGLLWPRLGLRPDVFRLRLLNGSNARTYRLHLVSVTDGQAGQGRVTVEHDRLLVIGTGGGLLWRAWQPGAADALTLAPAERLDVLLDLTDLAEGSSLYLINSAQAPFGGEPAPPLDGLLACGDRSGRNPYPWVARIDIDAFSPWAGGPQSLRDDLAAAELNPAFRRLVHDVTEPPEAGRPPQLSIETHAHRTILLAETDPPGHLYLQEIVEDAAGKIALQLPGDPAPKTYRVEGWLAATRRAQIAGFRFTTGSRCARSWDSGSCGGLSTRPAIPIPFTSTSPSSNRLTWPERCFPWPTPRVRTFTIRCPA